MCTWLNLTHTPNPSTHSRKQPNLDKHDAPPGPIPPRATSYATYVNSTPDAHKTYFLCPEPKRQGKQKKKGKNLGL